MKYSVFQIAHILVCLLLFNILQWNLKLDGEESFDTGYYQIQVMQGMKTGNKSLFIIYIILQIKTGIARNSILFPAPLSGGEFSPPSTTACVAFDVESERHLEGGCALPLPPQPKISGLPSQVREQQPATPFLHGYILSLS